MPGDRLHPLPSLPPGHHPALRRGQRLGKYKILASLGEGKFARVYSALDTLEGVRVALKIPHGHLVTRETLDGFYREVRLAARLEHPNILALKNAEFIGDRSRRRVPRRAAQAAPGDGQGLGFR